MVYVTIVGLIVLAIISFLFLMVLGNHKISYSKETLEVGPDTLPGKRIYYTATTSFALFTLVSAIVLLMGAV